MSNNEKPIKFNKEFKEGDKFYIKIKNFFGFTSDLIRFEFLNELSYDDVINNINDVKNKKEIIKTMKKLNNENNYKFFKVDNLDERTISRQRPIERHKMIVVIKEDKNNNSQIFFNKKYYQMYKFSSSDVPLEPMYPNAPISDVPFEKDVIVDDSNSNNKNLPKANPVNNRGGRKTCKNKKNKNKKKNKTHKS